MRGGVTSVLVVLITFQFRLQSAQDLVPKRTQSLRVSCAKPIAAHRIGTQQMDLSAITQTGLDSYYTTCNSSYHPN